MSELGELRASLARAQRELESANDRLDALEDGSTGAKATVLTPRGQDRQRNQFIVVGALSSAATAVILGLCALVFASKPPPPAPIIAASPPPPPAITIPPPPPVVSVAVPEPPAPPVVAPPEPPRTPTRIARVNPDVPRSRERAEPDEGMGSLTIVCLPSKCDSITDNGVALGPGDIVKRPVTAGPHRLTLHGQNGQTKTMRVDVHAEQLKEIRVSMVDASDVF